MKNSRYSLHFYFFLSVLVSFITNIHAESVTFWHSYIGAGLEFSTLDVRNNYYKNASGSEDSERYSNHAKGAVEHFFIGSQKKIKHFGFGGEIYGFLSQQKAKNYMNLGPNDNRREIIEREFGAGMKLKGGYYPNLNTFFYLHGGVEHAKFKYYGTLILAPESADFKKQKLLYGIPFGAGIETKVDSKWNARLEYTYTKYQTWKTGNLSTRYTVTSKLIPSAHAVLLGLACQI